jgi:regulator of sigma E protease
VNSTLAFLFVLGVLIFVHELGHFLMARRIGVRVLTFSLGFGPKLLSIRRGDTEYAISAIPLGGYVKMAGENPEDARTGANDEFLSKTKWQRFQVLVMGPVMNIVLAVVVLAVVLYQGAQVPIFDEGPVVVGAVAEDSVAKAAGIQPGDRILRLNDDEVENWDRFFMQISMQANREVTLVIDRGGQTQVKTMVPRGQGKYEIGEVGIVPVMRPQIAIVQEGKPAAEAGLQPGDVIVAIGGEQSPNYDRVLDLIKSHENKPLSIEVERAGQRQSVTVTPLTDDGVPRIGANISPTEFKTVEPTVVEALRMSVERNWESAGMILSTLKGLVTRETSVKQLMGPVAIADISGDAAEQGWIPLFGLMAMISLNLGLLNLMPIPVLDGGHIAILAMEGLSRRDFSMKVKEKMLLAGFVLLLMLMVTVIYNDLARVAWIQKLMPWR